VAKQLQAGLMRRTGRPDEQDWRWAKDQFAAGSAVRGAVSEVAPFGLLVDLPGTAVQGVVLAPGFSDAAAFARRADAHPAGSTVDVVVLGHSEGRLQIDLRLNDKAERCVR